MMRTLKINSLAVFTLTVIFQLTATLWYSKAMFADHWLHFLGKKITDFDGESPVGIISSLISGLLFCYTLAWLFTKLKVENGRHGLTAGFAIAVACFIFPSLTQDSFSLRPIGLTAINSGIVLINFSLAGLILGSWRKYKTN